MGGIAGIGVAAFLVVPAFLFCIIFLLGSNVGVVDFIVGE